MRGTVLVGANILHGCHKNTKNQFSADVTALEKNDTLPDSVFLPRSVKMTLFLQKRVSHNISATVTTLHDRVFFSTSKPSHAHTTCVACMHTHTRARVCARTHAHAHVRTQNGLQPVSRAGSCVVSDYQSTPNSCFGVPRSLLANFFQ